MLKKTFLASATGYIVVHKPYLTPDMLQAKDLDGLHGSVMAEITLKGRVLGCVVCSVLVRTIYYMVCNKTNSVQLRFCAIVVLRRA